MEYGCIADYVADSADMYIRLGKINQCITALYDLQLRAAGNADISEVHFNDGQTVVRTVFHSFTKLTEAIEGLERQRNMIRRALCGNLTRVINEESLR
jgi:hypothetical protein